MGSRTVSRIWRKRLTRRSIVPIGVGFAPLTPPGRIRPTRLASPWIRTVGRTRSGSDPTRDGGVGKRRDRPFRKRSHESS